MNAWDVWNCFLKQRPRNFLFFSSEWGDASEIWGKTDLCSGFASGTVAQLGALQTETLYVPKAIKCGMGWNADYGCCRLVAGWESWRGRVELYRHLLWVADGLTSVNVYEVACTLTQDGSEVDGPQLASGWKVSSSDVITLLNPN